MNDLSAFDGDAERERQICDFRVKGKTEAEVCQRHCHVWTYMDPARLQSILASCGSGSQLLTYIRLPYAA